ncbi:PadR family transcriptional regulator [Nocardiopsis suaedae]|uniref:PadR family transcriptional regulator n=1 Tax=Nocardiopsis suaedae TaxID=3018444 RepID=A0ABT4TPG2_9ACTN|nr:PadR family transcriptional regulator [Nocardiopsis suaedae]MDA2806164.1 PadR family transcriptional regulator [Nocardiopsis suaedae]
MSTRRARVLDLAVLGHLSEAPMHGYELRKRLNRELGAFRAFSYGSLYPCLRELLEHGLVAAAQPRESARGKRSRIVYRLTDQGRAALDGLLAESTPAANDDDCFGVRFTLFGRLGSDVRLRILGGRRDRMLQRLQGLHDRMAALSERGDPYTYELHRHRAETVQREVDWLDGLIERERWCAGRDGGAGGGIGAPAPPRGTAPPGGRRR